MIFGTLDEISIFGCSTRLRKTGWQHFSRNGLSIPERVARRDLRKLDKSGLQDRSARLNQLVGPGR